MEELGVSNWKDISFSLSKLGKYRSQFKCIAIKRCLSLSLFLLYIFLLLQSFFPSCFRSDSGGQESERKPRVSLFAQDACALLVLIKLEEHSVRFDPSSQTDLRIRDTITIRYVRISVPSRNRIFHIRSDLSNSARVSPLGRGSRAIFPLPLFYLIRDIEKMEDLRLRLTSI